MKFFTEKEQFIINKIAISNEIYWDDNYIEDLFILCERGILELVKYKPRAGVMAKLTFKHNCKVKRVNFLYWFWQGESEKYFQELESNICNDCWKHRNYPKQMSDTNQYKLNIIRY